MGDNEHNILIIRALAAVQKAISEIEKGEQAELERLYEIRAELVALLGTDKD